MKKWFVCFVMLLCGMVLAACVGPGRNDWQYNLPNAYCIQYINSRDILLKDTDARSSSSSIVIDRYVTAFCYNDRFVGLQCVDVPQDAAEEIDRTHPDFYLVDTQDDAVYGPFTEEVYRQTLEALKASEMCEWIATVPAPENAVFPYN